MLYLMSNLIRNSQGIDVHEVVHLGVPAINGVTTIPAHENYLRAFKASIDPDAEFLTAAQAAAELTAMVEAGTGFAQSFRDELSDAGKKVKRQLIECEKLANQDVSSSTDLRADADLVASSKENAQQVAGWSMVTDDPAYAVARIIAGRVDGLGLQTADLSTAVERFEKTLANVERAQAEAGRLANSFAEIEAKLSDPAREGAARDLRRAMHVQQQVDQLAGQIDAVRSSARDQLDQLDNLVAELAQIRGQA